MLGDRYGPAVRQVRRLLGEGSVAGMSEAELLGIFAARGDAAAFEALVARHGPMVLGVCGRLLADPNDVEDAFQATFLILVRKAGSIRDRHNLGPWLFGVARRVALRARADAARRRSRERPAANDLAAGRADDADAEVERRAVLDQELARLPEKYRAPLVLCYLSGLTHDEAAARLGCPVGTVRSRMSWARDRLRGRLLRRGVSPSAIALARGPSASPVPPRVLQVTIEAATCVASGRPVAGPASAGAAALMEGVLKSMFLSKFKAIAAGALLLGASAGGVGLLAQEADDAGGSAVKAPAGQPTSPPGPSRPAGGDIETLRRERDALAAQVRTLQAELQAAKKAQTPPGPARPFGADPPFPQGIVGLMNYPKPTIPTVESGRIIAFPMQARGGEPIWAQSVDLGVWKEYRSPRGEKINPIAGVNLLALFVEGPEITEVAVFDAEGGDWHPQVLREPAKGKAYAYLGAGVALYPIGRYLYAFGEASKTWDVLELPQEVSNDRIYFMQTYVKVEDGNRLHTFSYKSGRWSTLDTKTKE